MAGNTERYVVLTSGGDAPGMNAAIRAVVNTAISDNIQIFGAEMGFTGLVNQKLSPLSCASVAHCIQHGGTILKSGRCEPLYDSKTRATVIQFLKKSGITGLIVLGGNGSFQGAKKLNDEGGPAVIGIPCTIDNDIVGTEYCIGFDTCCNTALTAIDKIRETARSADSDFFIEVMGRASGFIAAEVGISSGADLIILPEFPLSDAKIIQHVRERKKQNTSSMIVAAESDHPGWTLTLAEKIKTQTGCDYRVCILGHTQRGGAPTIKDRLIATKMGYYAVKYLSKNKESKMIVMSKGEITHSDFLSPGPGTQFFANKHLLAINKTLSHNS